MEDPWFSAFWSAISCHILETWIGGRKKRYAKVWYSHYCSTSCYKKMYCSDWMHCIYTLVGWSVDRYVCRVQKCVGGIMWPKRAHAQGQIWVFKTDLWHLYYSFWLYARAALALMKKKRSLGMGNLKQTELQRTEERKAEDRSEKDRQEGQKTRG